MEISTEELRRSKKEAIFMGLTKGWGVFQSDVETFHIALKMTPKDVFPPTLNHTIIFQKMKKYDFLTFAHICVFGIFCTCFWPYCSMGENRSILKIFSFLMPLNQMPHGLIWHATNVVSFTPFGSNLVNVCWLILRSETRLITCWPLQ